MAHSYCYYFLVGNGFVLRICQRQCEKEITKVCANVTHSTSMIKKWNYYVEAWVVEVNKERDRFN